MTWKEKVDHIFTYYWIYMLVAVSLVLMIYLFINAIINYNQPNLINGTILGVRAKSEGMDAIYNVATDNGQRKGKAFLDEYFMLTDAMIETGSFDQSTAEYLTYRIYSRHLDYLILDERVLKIVPMPFLLDLRLVLPEEVLERWPLIYKEDPELGEEVPVGVIITDTEFSQKYLTGTGDIYIVAAGGILHTDAFIELVDFLLQ